MSLFVVKPIVMQINVEVTELSIFQYTNGDFFMAKQNILSSNSNTEEFENKSQPAISEIVPNIMGEEEDIIEEREYRGFYDIYNNIMIIS